MGVCVCCVGMGFLCVLAWVPNTFWGRSAVQCAAVRACMCMLGIESHPAPPLHIPSLGISDFDKYFSPTLGAGAPNGGGAGGAGGGGGGGFGFGALPNEGGDANAVPFDATSPIEVQLMEQERQELLRMQREELVCVCVLLYHYVVASYG